MMAMPPERVIQPNALDKVAQRCGTKPGLPSLMYLRNTSLVSLQTPVSTKKRAKWVREINSGLPANCSAPSNAPLMPTCARPLAMSRARCSRPLRVACKPANNSGLSWSMPKPTMCTVTFKNVTEISVPVR